MKKKISPVLIVLALAAVFLAGLIFILLVGPSKPNGFIEGSVVDAQTGEAVPGVDVLAVDSAGISYDKRENTDATRQDGSFRLELPPGDYTLHLNAAGYAPYQSTDTYTVTPEETLEISSLLGGVFHSTFILFGWHLTISVSEHRPRSHHDPFWVDVRKS